MTISKINVNGTEHDVHASHAAMADSATTANVATSMHAVTTAGDGAAYTATVSGITALTAGVSFIMSPHTNSTTTTPTLNVNGLGAKGLRMRGSAGTGTAVAASLAAWLTSGRPVQVTYNGLMWLAEVTRPAASDLSGTVAVANGGTGYTTIEDTTYTTARYRASALVSTETDPTTNGVINWTYE